MKHQITTYLIALCAAFTGATASFNAKAHSEASALSALSTMPLASVVAGNSAVVALPVVLSTAGSVLVVRALEVSATGTVYLLERTSDGARASVMVLSGGAVAASASVGTLVTVSVIGAGTVISAAGEVLAFIPNAVGRALLHNQRLTP
jgi:hypothetical protein